MPEVNEQPKITYTDEEIRTLEKMQKTLKRMYSDAAGLASANEDKETKSPEMATAVNSMRAAAGACASGYATVTQTLKLAKS